MLMNGKSFLIPILNHLERNNILTNFNQSGYSCKTQLLITLNDLLHSNDKGLQMDIAILDLSKAFDTVPHEELLCKLESSVIILQLLS